MYIHRKGIAVIVVNENDEVLLMQRGPNARTETGFWENPGGEIELDENPVDAAIREVREELGVDVEITKHLFSEESSPNMKGVIWSIDVFEGKVSQEPKIQEPDKCSAIAWFTKSRLSSVPLTSYTRPDFIRLGWLEK